MKPLELWADYWQPYGLLDSDRVLGRLGEFDLRMAGVVKLRYFAGLTVEATERALELLPRTVKRLWARARVWLYRELDRSEAPELRAVSSIDR